MKKQTPLETLTFRLLKQVEAVTKDFPKDRKHTLGQKIFDLALDLYDHISIAVWNPDEREEYLMKFRSDLNKTEALLVLSYEIGIILDKNFLDLQETVSTIGKQQCAWYKSTKQKRESVGNTESASGI